MRQNRQSTAWNHPLIAPLMLVLLLGVCAGNQTDQEETDPFAWLPLGDYAHLSSADYKAIRQFSDREYYPHIAEMAFDEGREPLPGILREGIERKIHCRLMKYKLARERIKPEHPDWIKVLTVENIGAYVWIYVYSALDPLIEECVSAGICESTGHLLSGRPVYTFRAAGREEMLFAWATPTQELLVAGEEVCIWGMYQAGMRLDLSILDGEDYLDLFEMAPDLGQKWSGTIELVRQRESLERLIANNAPDEIVESAKEAMKNGRRYSIVSQHYGEENVVVRKIDVFGDEDFAKEVFAERQKVDMSSTGLPEEEATYFAREAEATEFKLEKSLIVSEIAYDAELLEERNRIFEAARQKREQKLQDKK